MSNSSGFERCVTSPVCKTIAGGFGSLPMRSIAACNVALVSGLASLLKPIWLSLICTKVKPSAADAAKASPRAIPRGTPPETVQTRPVPAQAMHFKSPRRFMPG